MLIAIALGAVLSGIPGYLALAGGENAVQQVVARSSASAGAMLDASESGVKVLGMNPHLGVMVVGGTASLLGIGLAWWFHLARRTAATDLRTRLLASPATRWLPTAIERKWYFDEISHAAATLPAWGASHLMHLADRYFIDGLLVNGIGRIPPLLARLFQPLYSGRLQGYAVTMAGGVALILLWAMWSWVAGGAS